MESYSEYLEHHGIKGQRWGVRRTPEQLGHRRVEGKQRVIEGKPGGMFKMRVVQGTEPSKAEQKELKKKERLEQIAEKKAKEQLERREKILKDPRLLYKHRYEFSPEEIKKAMGDIQTMQNLRQLSVNELSAGEVYLNTAVKYAKTGIEAYNTAAKIYNAFNKDDKHTAPIIGAKSEAKQKKKLLKDFMNTL